MSLSISKILDVREKCSTKEASDGMDIAIEARDLVKIYPGDVKALEGIGFEVPEGTIFGLLGPNGAGKSTTVKVLTTLSRPDAGEAFVSGIDVLKRPDQVRRAIGVVAQKPGVDVDATGRENLILQGQLFGLRGTVLRARADDLLRRFGLSDAARRPVRTYSGGMQRRLDIATALVHRPKVLFLDEPTTGLDPEVRADMWGEISRLATDEGLTILLTTHYLEEADRLAARLAIVDKGRVVANGSPDELKGSLHGEALHLELAETSADGVPAALMALPEVRDVVTDGRAVHARVDNGARAIPAVMQTLDARGIVVSSVTISRPSLDDVYLGLTGRAYEPEGSRDELVEVS
jgi:ABC-2 type transport system ATP-binding protein